MGRQRSADQRVRAVSFGSVARSYERFRPRPPSQVLDWILPTPVRRAVDLGAGTGALTRLLVQRAREVIAVEPDPRMREVLVEKVAGAAALGGTAERIPLATGSVDAVLVASAWHWMDTAETSAEVARILRPGGVLGVVWAGVDWSQGVMAELWAASHRDPDRQPERQPSPGGDRSERRRLALPDGAPFSEPEHELMRWRDRRSQEEVVGLLGTYSRTITLPDRQRAHLLDEARRLLAGAGPAAVTVDLRADCWRARRRR